MKKLILLVIILLIGCGGESQPQSDSEFDFAKVRGEARIDIDFGVYTISGTVQPVMVQRQQVIGYSGETEKVMVEVPFLDLGDKSVVRILVENATYNAGENELVTHQEITEAIDTNNLIGKVIVLKVTDSKAFLIQNGDYLTLSCRAQAENLSAVVPNEPFDPHLQTWELDYCRYPNPVVSE